MNEVESAAIRYRDAKLNLDTRFEDLRLAMAEMGRAAASVIALADRCIPVDARMTPRKVRNVDLYRAVDALLQREGRGLTQDEIFEKLELSGYVFSSSSKHRQRGFRRSLRAVGEAFTYDPVTRQYSIMKELAP